MAKKASWFGCRAPRTAQSYITTAAHLLVIALAPVTSYAQLSELHPIEFNGVNWSPNFSKGLETWDVVMDIRRFARIPYNPNALGGLSAPRLSSMKYARGIDGFFVTDEGLFGSDAPESGSLYQVTPDGSNVRKVIDFETLRDLTHEDGADAFGQNRFWNFQGGLRSIAFHPDFDTPGTLGYRKLYTSQIEIPPGDISSVDFLGTVPNPNVSGHSVVSEWIADINQSGELSLDANSFREVIRIAPRAGNHPVRQIAFDPFKNPGDADYGLLHVLHGDGAEGNDIAPAVDLAGNTAFGKMLRINPLEDTVNQTPYSIPASNPFFTNGSINDASGDGFLDEIYTHKHRNPHNLAFAQDESGDSVIFVAEIGRNTAEEINLVREGGGGNYGWNSGSANREGTVGSRPDDPYIYPVSQYGRSGTSGRKAAVAGGFAIQNGSELDGHYFFADFPNEDPIVKKPIMAISIEDALNANLVGDPDELTPVTPRYTTMLFDHDDNARTASQQVGSYLDILLQDDTGFSRTDIRFAQGPAGEMYLLNKRNGWIYQVTNTAEQLGSLKLVVDAGTGQTNIVSDDGLPVTLQSYSVFSGAGALNTVGWDRLRDAPGLSGWQEDEPSEQVLREVNTSGGSIVGPTGLSIGETFSSSFTDFGSPLSLPDILRFKYTTADGEFFNGIVEIVGDTLLNNLLLTVDPETGQAILQNESLQRVRLRGYSILSDSGSLKPGDSDWSSLSDQAIPGVDEGNVSSNALSELIPLDEDSLLLPPGQEFDLGDLFLTAAEGGSEDVRLSFVIEEIVSPEGDYNNDGIVDAADYTVWRDALNSDAPLPNEGATPGVTTQEDYLVWSANFGAVALGSNSFRIIEGVVAYGAVPEGVAIPEPTCFALAVATLLTAGASCRARCLRDNQV